MPGFFRSAGTVIAGLVVGALVVASVEAVSSRVYPLPPGVDPTSMTALKAHMAQLPLGAFLFVLAAWAAGSFLGSWLATRLGSGRHAAHGAIVGAMLLLAGVANMLMLPHPTWFWAAALVVFSFCTYLGTKAGARGPSGSKSPLLRRDNDGVQPTAG